MDDMKESVYIETSVISYYSSRLSRDLIVAGHQQITKEWVDKQSHKFDLFISEAVINECSVGDEGAAKGRLELIERFGILELKPEILTLAQVLITNDIIPSKYPEDALHIATATIHGIDYLLTWNCRHIANARIRILLEKLINKSGYVLPVICTPEELMEE